MSLLKIYFKALCYLSSDRKSVFFLCFANIVLSAVTIAEPLIFGRVIDSISQKNDPFAMLALWACLGGFNIIAVALVSRGADRIAHARRGDILAKSYQKIISMPLSWHHNRGTSHLLHILLRATESLFGLWLEFMRTHLATALGLIFLIPTALSVDRRMAGVLFGLGIAYVLITRFVMKKTKNGQEKVEKHYHTVFEHVTDTVNNISVLQGYDRIRFEAEGLRNHIRKLLATQNPVLDWWAVANALNRLSATLSMMIILIIGSWLVMKGELPVGSLVAFTGFASLLVSRLDQVSAIVSQIFDSKAKLEDFYRIEEECKQNIEPKRIVNLKKVNGSIRFEKVSFSFSGKTKTLKDISFEIKPGETVALVGPTGSGKTTLVNLIQSIYTPDSGKIFIDDIDISTITRQCLRRSIATVFQHVGLLNRSIRANIRVGNEEAKEDTIAWAAKSAQAHDFIIKKENSYESRVGDQGSRLSGGERQRIGIARAVLKNAPILILDEATSALDVETEEKIKKAMKELCYKRTVIMIAHRLATVQDADRVFFIENGSIVEMGSFHELCARGGRFSEFLSLGSLNLESEKKIASFD